VLSHDLLSEFGITYATSYIVEASVSKSAASNNMFIVNPYNHGGLTFGIQVYDVTTSAFSDGFAHVNLAIYGGGTAL
jgi:hypothetical protein